MIYEKHLLRDLFPQLEDVGYDANIVSYIPDSPRAAYNKSMQKPPRPCVIVCPGGGYSNTVAREAECVALAFVGNEFPTFVVNYSCAKTYEATAKIHFPIQVQEISCAVAYVKRNAERFDIDPERIFILGFSAGGHAVASTGCFWSREFAYMSTGLAYGENKPCGMILSYPVISSGEYAHRDSFVRLLGKDATEEQLESVSLENCVSSDTVPTFMWHTCFDELVPVQNSILFAKALADAKVPFEYHIYPTGPHGMSTSTEASVPPHIDDKLDSVDVAYNHEWVEKAIHWLLKF